jgi:hypothetical protein
MGAMKPDQKFNKGLQVKLRSLELSHYVARDKFEDAIMATTADLNVGIGKDYTFQFKIPYMVVLSRLTNTHGVGDISLSLSRNIVNQENFQINGTIGAKIPTGKSDVRSSEGLPLPMYLQPTLGTFDLVAGASFLSRGWLVAVGVQQPLAHTNDNQFLWEEWEGNPKFNTAFPFPQSRGLRRQADVMLRIEKNIRFSKFNVHIGLLEIHRFKEDKVLLKDLETGQDIEREVAGSNGSALSLIVGGTYHFNTKSAIKLIFGDRLLQRDKNPDGLSREQVYQLAYQINF